MFQIQKQNTASFVRRDNPSKLGNMSHFSHLSELANQNFFINKQIFKSLFEKIFFLFFSLYSLYSLFGSVHPFIQVLLFLITNKSKKNQRS